MDAFAPPASPSQGYARIFLFAATSGIGYGLGFLCGALLALVWGLASEAFGIGRCIWHVLAVGAATLLAWLVLWAGERSTPALRPSLDIALAGLGGGLLYWALAGRSAGGWRGVKA